MPLSTISSANPGSTNTVTTPSSGRVDWVLAVSDATAAAASTAFQFAPLTYTGTVSNLIKVGANTTRCYLRARFTSTTSAAVAPTVKVYGVKGASVASATDVWRIDNMDGSAAGITLAGVEATPSTSNMLNITVGATTYFLSDIAGQDDDGYDCIGADFIIVLVSGAATATSGACDVLVGLLN